MVRSVLVVFGYVGSVYVMFVYVSFGEVTKVRLCWVVVG